MKMTKPAKERDSRLCSFFLLKEQRLAAQLEKEWSRSHECYHRVTGPKEGQPVIRPRRPAENEGETLPCTRKITGVEKKPAPRERATGTRDVRINNNKNKDAFLS